jgi:hypothetical protein
MIKKNIISDRNVEFRIVETEKQYIVEAQVPKRQIARDAKVQCNTEDVRIVLGEFAETSALTLSESPSRILTNSRNEHLNGRWIFEKPKNQKKQRKPATSRQTRPERKEDVEENQKTKQASTPAEKKLGTSLRDRTRAIANKREKIQEPRED